MKLAIERSTAVHRSGRVAQIEGMFDLSATKRSVERWDVNLPIEDRPWNIGLIVGPSGSGKSTIAREVFGESLRETFTWSDDRSLVDDFPAEMGIKDVADLLSSVGFAAPPQWLRPFRVLSTGQQMRVSVARLLAEQPDLAVMDEFTSVVTRTALRGRDVPRGRGEVATARLGVPP
jgi:ABC-type Mn2+/Zn2+ transport system ATPase subunit